MLGKGNGQVEQVRTNVAMKAWHWYFVAATYDAPTGRVCLYQEPLAKWPLDSTVQTMPLLSTSMPRGEYP